MKKQDKRIYFITGGGTGGHIYPAISIAKELKNDPTTEKLYYIGKAGNLEERIAKQEGFEFLPIDITSMPRKLDFNFLKWSVNLQSAIWKALYYLYKYKPNAVFGTGGYVSAPAIMAAILSNTPFVIHDSDAYPGIVSRYVSRGARLVSLAFEDAKKFIQNKNIKVFGNPIKQDFFTITKEEAKNILGIYNGKTLLVMGGSQGAMNINHSVICCLEYFTTKLNMNVVLQTGAKNYDATLDELRNIYPDYVKNSRIIIKPYFDNMAVPLRAADMVVARAGSLSLSEIAAVEVPSILVPYPYAAADHQRKNAKCYEQAGASIYIDDFDLNKDVLEKTIVDLVNNPQKLADMKSAVKRFCKPDATKEIADAIKEISN